MFYYAMFLVRTMGERSYCVTFASYEVNVCVFVFYLFAIFLYDVFLWTSH